MEPWDQNNHSSFLSISLSFPATFFPPHLMKRVQVHLILFPYLSLKGAGLLILFPHSSLKGASLPILFLHFVLKGASFLILFPHSSLKGADPLPALESEGGRPSEGSGSSDPLPTCESEGVGILIRPPRCQKQSLQL